MSYSRNEGGYDNPSPWATTAPDEGNDMSKLLESLRNSAGSGTMSNLATSLVAQAVQKRPGGMLIGETHFGGQGSAPMGGPSFNNSEPHGGDRYIDRSGGRDDYPRGSDNLAPLSNSSIQGSAPMGGPSFNNREPFGGDGYIDRSGGRDDYPRGSDNLAPLSNSSRSQPPFRRSRSRSRDNCPPPPLSGENHFSAPMGGPSFNNSEPREEDRYIDRFGGRDDDASYFVRDDYPSGQGSAPMGGPSFNDSELHRGDRYNDRSGGRDDYPRERDNLAPLSNSSRSKPPFRRSRSRQSHCREVPRWEIFMGQELRFWQDMGRMADFPAFIASKSFDL